MYFPEVRLMLMNKIICCEIGRCLGCDALYTVTSASEERVALISRRFWYGWFYDNRFVSSTN